MDCQHTDCFWFNECNIKDMAENCAVNKDFFNIEDVAKGKKEKGKSN